MKRIGIHIEPWQRAGGAPWRAWTYVGPELSEARGTCGGASENGPWLEAFGGTPHEATDALLRRLGEAYVQAAVWSKPAEASDGHE